MREVEVLDPGKAGAVEIAQLLEVSCRGLADNAHGAVIVEEHVVHQRGQPRSDEVAAAKLVLTDDHMPAAIVVVGVVERRDAVLLGPVQLEIAEGTLAEAADQRQHVRIRQQLRKILAMLVEVARLVPECIHAWIVEPAVNQCQIAFDVDHTKADDVRQPRNEARIDPAGWLRWPPRMPFAAGHHVGQRKRRPGRVRQPGLAPLHQHLRQKHGRAIDDHCEAIARQRRCGRRPPAQIEDESVERRMPAKQRLGGGGEPAHQAPGISHIAGHGNRAPISVEPERQQQLAAGDHANTFIIADDRHRDIRSGPEGPTPCIEARAHTPLTAFDLHVLRHQPLPFKM